MKKKVIPIITALLLTAVALSAQNIILSKENLQPANVFMTLQKLDGENVVRIEKDPIIIKDDEPTYVKIKNLDFKDGTIEIKVLSRLLSDAPTHARGFIGVAFHINPDDTEFESIYIRPTNGRSADQVRRNHSIQYFAYPNYKFDRLRKESPEMYEFYADITLNEWITLRIEVDGEKAKLFLNNNEKVAVIGTGNVAKALINGLISEGYELKVGSRNSSKDNENIAKLKEAHRNVDVVSYAEAVSFAELVVLPVPGGTLVDVIKEIGTDKVQGKIVWDITNPFSAEAPVNSVIKLITSPDESLAEKVQKLLPSSYVVKAMNTVGAHLMYKPTLSESGSIFLAGNENKAKEDVASVVKKFGWDSYDAGKIESSRALEYMGQLYVAQGILNNGWNTTFKYVK